MESLWNSTWISIRNSLEIPWNPHGPIHGIHMECIIPWNIAGSVKTLLGPKRGREEKRDWMWAYPSEG